MSSVPINTRCTTCSRDFGSIAELEWHSRFITSCVQPRPLDDMNRQEIIHLRAELARVRASHKDILERLTNSQQTIDQYEECLRNLSEDLRSGSPRKATYSRAGGDTITIYCKLFLLAEFAPHDNPQPQDTIRIRLFYDDAGDRGRLRDQLFAGTTVMRVARVAITRPLPIPKEFKLNDHSRILSGELALSLIVSWNDDWICIQRGQVSALWAYLTS